MASVELLKEVKRRFGDTPEVRELERRSSDIVLDNEAIEGLSMNLSFSGNTSGTDFVREIFEITDIPTAVADPKDIGGIPRTPTQIAATLSGPDLSVVEKIAIDDISTGQPVLPPEITQSVGREKLVRSRLGELRTLAERGKAEQFAAIVIGSQTVRPFGFVATLSRTGKLASVEQIPGEIDANIEATRRILNEVGQRNPGFLNQLALKVPAFENALIEFAAIPGPTKGFLSTINPTLRAGIIGAGRFGIAETITAFDIDEGVKEKVLNITTALPAGFTTGVAFNLLFRTIAKLPGAKNSIKAAFAGKDTNSIVNDIIKAQPEFAKIPRTQLTIAVQNLKSSVKAEGADLRVTVGEFGKLHFRAVKPVKVKISPTFAKKARPGFAEFGEPAEIIKKAGQLTGKALKKEAPKIAEAFGKTAAGQFAIKLTPEGKHQIINRVTQQEIGSPFDDINQAKSGATRLNVLEEEQLTGIAKTRISERKILVPKTAQDKADIEAGIRKEGIEVTQSEMNLLRSRLKAEASAAIAGFKAGKEKGAQITQEVKASFRLKLADNRTQKAITKEVRKDALDIIRGIPDPKQRVKLETALRDATKPSDLDVIWDRAGQALEAIEKQDAFARLDNSIKKIERQLKKQKTKANLKKVIRPEQEKQLRTLIDSFRNKPLTSAKKNDIQGLRAFVENTKKGFADDPEFGEAYAESIIPDNRLKLLDEAARQPLDQLNVDAINSITDELQRIVHLVTTKNRLILNNKIADRNAKRIELIDNADRAVSKRDTTEAFNTLSKDIPQVGPLVPRVQAIAGQKIKQAGAFFIGSKNADLKTLGRVVVADDFSTATQIYETEFSDGRNRQADLQLEAFDNWAESFEKAGVTIEDLQGASLIFFDAMKSPAGKVLRDSLASFGLPVKPTSTVFETITYGGKKVSVTRAEIMSLIMHTRNPENLSALFNSGLTSKTFVGLVPSPEELIKIRADFAKNNPKLVKIMDGFTEINLAVLQPGINLESNLLEGHSKAILSDHWHMERLRPNKVLGKQDLSISLLDSPGFLKERIGGKDPLVLRDFFEVAHASIAGAAEYAGMARPLRQATLFTNDKGFQDTLKNNGYNDQLNGIIDSLGRVRERTVDSNVFGRFVALLMRGKTRAVLIDPAISAGQWTSVYGYATETGSETAKLIFSGPPSDTAIKRLKKNIPSFRFRAEGGMSSIAIADLSQTDIAKRAITGKSDLANKTVGMIHFVDTKAVGRGYEVAEFEVNFKGNLSGRGKEYWDWWDKNNPELKRTSLTKESPEYWEAIRARGDFMVGRTQPMFHPEHRSELTGAKNPVVKSFFQFRSYIDQSLKMSQRAWADLTNKKISKADFSKRIGAVYGALASNIIVKSVVNAVIFGTSITTIGLLASLAGAPLKTLPLIGRQLDNAVKRFITILAGEKPPRKVTEVTTIPESIGESAFQVTSDITDSVAFELAGEDEKADKARRRAISKGIVEALEVSGVPASDIKRFGERVIAEEPTFGKPAKQRGIKRGLERGLKRGIKR